MADIFLGGVLIGLMGCMWYMWHIQCQINDTVLRWLERIDDGQDEEGDEQGNRS